MTTEKGPDVGGLLLPNRSNTAGGVADFSKWLIQWIGTVETILEAIVETGFMAEMISDPWCIRKYLIQLGTA